MWEEAAEWNRISKLQTEYSPRCARSETWGMRDAEKQEPDEYEKKKFHGINETAWKRGLVLMQNPADMVEQKR